MLPRLPVIRNQHRLDKLLVSKATNPAMRQELASNLGGASACIDDPRDLLRFGRCL